MPSASLRSVCFVPIADVPLYPCVLERQVRRHVAGIGTKIICHDMSYYTDNFVDLMQGDRVSMLVS